MYTKIFQLLVLFISIYCNIYSQGDIKLHLKVTKNNQSPVTNKKVIAIDILTLKIVEGETNSNGIVEMHLINGSNWDISIGEMKNCMRISAIPDNTVEMDQAFIYDMEGYLRKNSQNKNRTDLGFEIIKSQVNADTKFTPPNCLLIVKMRHPEGQLLPGIRVRAVSLKDSVIYEQTTGDNGEACFVLKNKSNYDIDINDVINYTYSDFGEEYIIKPFTIHFAPTIIDEVSRNDTVFQKGSNSMQASSERALVKIIVTGERRVNEPVYLRGIKTGKIYTTNTNSSGVAYMLVPIGNTYLVDFIYEKNADAINLVNATEMTKAEYTINYKPDPRLEFPEKYIPTPDKLFIKKFNTFLTKQFEKPKKKPFLLKIIGAHKINKNSKEALFKIEFTGLDSKSASLRFPLNVAFVLDRSGSMSCCKRAESLKEALSEIGKSLREGDQASFVFFNDEAQTVTSPKGDYLSVIDLIIEYYLPGGGTNIYRGLEKGVEELMIRYDEDKSNRIILLTDGYGNNPPKKITDFVQSKYKEGIEFSAIGLGEGFNQNLLELIAKKGNGTFSYIDNSTNLPEVMLKNVKEAFGYVAKDLKIDIYYDKQLIFSQLYGYDAGKDSLGAVSFQVGKVPPNVNQIAFLKFRLDEPTPDIENKPLELHVSYFDLMEKKNVEYKESIYLKWSDESDCELLMEQEEKMLYAIAILNQSLKLMAEAQSKGDTKAAKEALEESIKQIEEIFPEAKPKQLKKLFDEANKYILMLKMIETNKNK